MPEALDTAANRDPLETPISGDAEALARRWTRQRLLEPEREQAEPERERERTAEGGGEPERAEARAGYRAILAVWAGSRLLVLAVAGFVQLTGWPARHWQPSLVGHPFALLAVWDGHWYRMIASQGYFLLPGHQSDPAFFPAFPALLHGLHLLGLSLNGAGMLVGNLGFLVGLFAFYALSRRYLAEAEARRAAILAAIFPFGFVFSMVYPEGLIFAALSLAGLCALDERWLPCMLCAGLAALGRPQGLFVALPIAAAVASRWSALSLRGRMQGLAAVLAGPAALASFSLYLWRSVADPLAWSTAERAWGRTFSPAGPYRAAAELATAPLHGKSWLFRDAVFCLLYLACLLVALRAGLPRAWIAAGALMVLLPLASGSFTSDARFGLLALPVYWGLALLARRRLLERALLTTSPLLLAGSVLTIWLRWP